LLALRPQGAAEDHASAAALNVTYCDGCFHRGEKKELIEPNYAKVRLTDETATVLDLCFDCMPFYESYAKQQDDLASSSARKYHREAKVQEAEFWKKVKHGGKTLESKATKKDRIGQSKTQGISQR
jgi:hypothetical protein